MQSRVGAEIISKPSALREHERVRLLKDLSVPEGVFAAGLTGTIVHVHKKGVAFEIEFTVPTPAVVTVEAADVEPLNG